MVREGEGRGSGGWEWLSYSLDCSCLCFRISGLIIALVERNSYFVVFHASQSIVLSIIYCFFAIIFAIIDRFAIAPTGMTFSIMSFIWFVLYLILIIVCSIFAVKNQHTGDLFQLILVGGKQ